MNGKSAYLSSRIKKINTRDQTQKYVPQILDLQWLWIKHQTP